MTRTILLFLVVTLATASVALAQDTHGGATPSAPSVYDLAVQAQRIEQQRSVARADEAIQKASDALGQGNFIDAEIQIENARSIVVTGRQLSAEQKAELTSRIDALGVQVKAARTAWRRERDVEGDRQIAEREAMRRQSLAKMVERQTESHWAQLKQFREQRKYTQAMAEAKALLQLNPRDAEARKVLYDLEIKAQMATQVAVRMSRESETVRSLVAVEDSATPYADLVRYPADWERLTLKRLRGLARDQQGYSAEAEQTMFQLHQRTDLDMTDVSLANVLTFLSESTKIPIVIDPHLQQDTGVDPAQSLVTLHARQLTLEQALRMILPEGTGYRIEDDHIVVASREKSNPLRLVSYPVQDIVAEIPDHGKSVPRFNLTEALNQANQGGGGGGGTGLWDDVSQDEEKAGATGQKIIDMIKKFVTATDPRIAAWEDLGGTASIEYYNGFLLVTQTDEGHRKVREILSRL